MSLIQRVPKTSYELLSGCGGVVLPLQASPGLTQGQQIPALDTPLPPLEPALCLSHGAVTQVELL